MLCISRTIVKTAHSGPGAITRRSDAMRELCSVVTGRGTIHGELSGAAEHRPDGTRNPARSTKRTKTGNFQPETRSGKLRNQVVFD
jgi:hypothetical protein